MSKPWEENWILSDGRWIEVDDGPVSVTVARFGFDNETGGARALLASAAPDMARALQSLVYETWGSQGVEEAKSKAIAALRKAGVPL